MGTADQATVSLPDLEALQRAVEWANFLNADSSGTDLLDPCCMLEALSDVYTAAHRLVDGSDQLAARSGPGLDALKLTALSRP